MGFYGVENLSTSFNFAGKKGYFTEKNLTALKKFVFLQRQNERKTPRPIIAVKLN